jgi:flagellar hook-length control protein FliK
MNTIGSMKSFAADTFNAPKTAKASNGRGDGDIDAAQTGFDALMASILPIPQASAPQVVEQVAQPIEAPTAVVETKTTAQENTDSVGQTPTEKMTPVANASDAIKPQTVTQPVLGQAIAQPATPAAPIEPGDIQAVLAQLVALSNGDASAAATATNVQTAAVTSAAATAPTSATAVAVPTKAEVPAASAAEAAAQILAATETATGAASSTPVDASTQHVAKSVQAATTSQNGESGAQVTPTPSDASAPTTAQTNQTNQATSTIVVGAKPKAIDGEAIAKSNSKVGETATMMAESGATNQGTTTETAGLPSDTSARPTYLTPHTIPMLAATMVRRLESGAKQFSMRLDPPELGQVEVKLTVAADKKVRAVVSADRPEALADLVRSARDLVRALQEAGLDLEENGLTFSLNDQAGNQSRNGQNDEAGTFANKNAGHLKLVGDSEAEQNEATTLQIQSAKSNDPFQSWQRARIALTA